MKTKVLWASAILVGLLVGLTPATVTYSEPAPPAPKEVLPPKDVEFASPLLYHICSCESQQGGSKPPTHYASDGSVLRGKVNPKDIGICQVNLTYHEKEAEAMGLDLFDRNDNVTFSNYLFRTQGSTPWNWSKSCWGKFASTTNRT